MSGACTRSTKAGPGKSRFPSGGAITRKRCLRVARFRSQKVFLPVHRMLKYVGSLYAKYESGPREIEVSIRRRDHPEEVFAGSKIPISKSFSSGSSNAEICRELVREVRKRAPGNRGFHPEARSPGRGVCG